MEKRKGSSGRSFIGKLAMASVLAVLGLIIFALTLFHLVPPHIYASWLQGTIRERSGLVVESASFATAFPLAFTLEGVKVLDPAGREVLRVDSLEAALNPLGLLSGLRVDLEGEASGGRVSGTARAGLFGPSFDIDARGVGFDALPALGSAGVRVDGSFDAVMAVVMEDGCPRGTLRARGVEFRDAQVSFRGLPLPIGDVEEAGLTAVFAGCGMRLDGLWIESSDLSARLKGTVKFSAPLSASPVEMTLELVPGEAMLKKEYLLSLLAPYKKSANFYSIPVKGTLGSFSSAF